MADGPGASWAASVALVLAFALMEGAVPGQAASPPAVASSPSSSPSPSPAPTATAKGATSAIVVDDAGARTLLGMPVQTSKGEDLGHVVDIVVDRNGSVLAAIVDFGGFLGVGSRKIAVDWRMLHFPKTDGLTRLVADLPRDALQKAPAYKAGEPIVIMGAPAPAQAAPAAAPLAAPSPSPSKS